MPGTTAARPRRRRTPSALVLLTVAILAAPTALVAAPALGFAPSSVTATGVTPAGFTVFFSVSHEREPWMRRLVTRAAPMYDDDSDGAVAYVPGPEVADTSVWAAVDVADGAFAVDAPAGFELTAAAADWKAMTATSGRLVDDRQDLELVVVRPGAAAWQGHAFDGAAGDLGAAEDGAVEVRLSDLTLIWKAVGLGQKGTVLEELQKGDVVVGIDPVHLLVWSFVYGSQGSIVGQAGSGR